MCFHICKICKLFKNLVNFLPPFIFIFNQSFLRGITMKLSLPSPFRQFIFATKIWKYFSNFQEKFRQTGKSGYELWYYKSYFSVNLELLGLKNLLPTWFCSFHIVLCLCNVAIIWQLFIVSFWKKWAKVNASKFRLMMIVIRMDKNELF